MSRRIRNAVAWITLAQVVLVGAVGTGLHSLFGCEHGPCGCCTEAFYDASAAENSTHAGCDDCAFCRRAAERRHASTAESAGPHREASDRATATARAAGCDGCAVCNLLDEYQNVTPFELDPLAIELASGEATRQRENRVLAAEIRLTLSRGPPAV